MILYQNVYVHVLSKLYYTGDDHDVPSPIPVYKNPKDPVIQDLWVHIPLLYVVLEDHQSWQPIGCCLC